MSTNNWTRSSLRATSPMKKWLEFFIRLARMQLCGKMFKKMFNVEVTIPLQVTIRLLRFLYHKKHIEPRMMW